MRHIGEDVCPRVVCVRADSYDMEPLDHWAPSVGEMPAAIEDIKHLLRSHVWNRDPLFHHADWREAVMRTSAAKCAWIDPAIVRDLYPSGVAPKATLIHGDPTFANVMLKDGALRLIDAVPCRDDVPSLRELDFARMLQSAYGWEHALDASWPALKGEHLALIFKDEPAHLVGELTARAFFWASYNCGRILGHDFDARSSDWARTLGPRFMEKCRAICTLV